MSEQVTIPVELSNGWTATVEIPLETVKALAEWHKADLLNQALDLLEQAEWAEDPAMPGRAHCTWCNGNRGAINWPNNGHWDSCPWAKLMHDCGRRP